MPRTTANRDTAAIMDQVLMALIPGGACLVYFFGAGVAINVVVAMGAAVAAEALVLSVRRLPLTPAGDRTALVTGALLGLSLPPYLPVWLVVFDTLFAMIFGKHLYGGLGQNPFNPAMVGYAMLIVAFPLAMSLWPAPGGGNAALIGYKLGKPIVDGMSMATPLDAFRMRNGATVSEFWRGSAVMAGLAGKGWEWVNAAFMAGGLYLIYRKACDWIMPVSMLVALGVLALVFYDGGSSDSLGSPLFHWFSGATMLGAFFIVTDPVTSPDGRAAKVIFGAGVGILVFIIRSIGAYPDGVAFAVLLMNATAPFLDQVRWRWT